MSQNECTRIGQHSKVWGGGQNMKPDQVSCDAKVNQVKEGDKGQSRGHIILIAN